MLKSPRRKRSALLACVMSFTKLLSKSQQLLTLPWGGLYSTPMIIFLLCSCC